MKQNKKTIKIILGILIISLNLFWIWHSSESWYKKRYSGIEYSFANPDEVLYFHILCGLIGFFVGIKVINGKYTIVKGILISFLLLFLGIFLGQVYHSF